MKKNTKLLKQYLKPFEYKLKARGEILVIKKSKLKIKAITLFFSFIGLLGLIYTGYTYINTNSLNINYLIPSAVVFLGFLITFLLIKTESFIINKGLRTIRNVNIPKQNPDKYLVPLRTEVINDPKSKNPNKKLITIEGKFQIIPFIRFNAQKIDDTTIIGLLKELDNYLTPVQLANTNVINNALESKKSIIDVDVDEELNDVEN